MGLSSRFDLDEVRKGSAKRSSSCPLASREQPVAAPAPPKEEPKEVDESTKLTDVPEEPSTKVAEYAVEKMRKLSGEQPRKWLRVVHSGYGSQAWVEAMKDSVHTHVATARHQEGIYVLVRKGAAISDLVDDLMAMNLVVRKKTQFKEMKRSNKSRLQFKASVTIFPTTAEQAEHDKAVPVEEEQSQSNDETEPVGVLAHSVVVVPKGPFGRVQLDQLDQHLRQSAAQPQFLQSYLEPSQPQKLHLDRTISTVSTASTVGTPAGYWNQGYTWEEGGQEEVLGKPRPPAPLRSNTDPQYMQQMGMQQMPMQQGPMGYPMQQAGQQIVYVQMPAHMVPGMGQPMQAVPVQ